MNDNKNDIKTRNDNLQVWSPNGQMEICREGILWACHKILG